MDNTSNILIKDLKVAAFKGGKLLFLRHLIGFCINFTGSFILARLLGPEILGLYFISYTIFLILRGIIDFGIKTHFIRLPISPSQSEFRAAFTFQQGLSMVCLIIAGLLAQISSYWYGHSELFFLVFSAGIGAYFYSWQSIPLSLFERKLEYNKITVIEIGEIMAFNVVSIIGSCIGTGILGLAIGNILRGFLPGLLSVALSGVYPIIEWDRKAITSLAKIVFPIFGSDSIVWIIFLAPPILVGSFAGVRALGSAQMAYNVLGYTMIIATVFQRISLTAFSRIQSEQEQFNKMVQKSLFLLSLVYVPLIMGMVSLSPWWVPLIYGEEWKGMEKVMFIAAFPLTGSALFSILLSALLAKGHASLVFKQNLIHAFIYWIIMAYTASTLESVSVPFSHLVAMSAGILFIYGYNKYCGKLNYRPIILIFFIGSTAMSFFWLLTIKGNIIIPFMGVSLFLFISIFKIIKEGLFSTIIKRHPIRDQVEN